MLEELAQKLVITTGPKETPIIFEGPLPTLPGGGYKFTNLASVVTAALPLLFAISGLILFAYLLWGGFDYLTSMGDPKKAEAGKGKITNAIIGFIIIFVSFWLVQIIDFLFNLGIYTPKQPPILSPTPTP